VCEEWRKHPLAREYPYGFVEIFWLKHACGSEMQVNIYALVGIGVNIWDREIPGVAEGSSENAES
jgi:hypothetical protein